LVSLNCRKEYSIKKNGPVTLKWYEKNISTEIEINQTSFKTEIDFMGNSRLMILSIVLTLILQIHLVNTLHSQGLDSLVVCSLHFAEQQLIATVAEFGETLLYPDKTGYSGNWETRSPGSWVTGWFPGCLWYMYEWTGQDIWKIWAEKWTEGLENSQYKTNSHDVGFIIFCSFGNGFRLTNKGGYREIILQAAHSLST